MITHNPFIMIPCLIASTLGISALIHLLVYQLPEKLYQQWRLDCEDFLKTPNPTSKKRYALIAGVALCFSLFVFLKQSTMMTSFFTLIFTYYLLALSFIDMDHQLLPDQLTLSLLWLGLLVNSFQGFIPLHDAVLGAVIGYVSLWSCMWVFKWITGKIGIGYGDFKLLAALGAWVGWKPLPAIILLASFLGAIVGLLLLTFQKKDYKTPIPFGPYLAISGWIAFVYGDDMRQLCWSLV